MKFHQVGPIDTDDNRSMSHKLVNELLGRTLLQELIFAVKAYRNIWKSLDEQIAKLDKELKHQAERVPKESTYRSVPEI